MSLKQDIIKNMPPTFFQKYKKEILWASFSIIFFLIIIFFLYQKTDLNIFKSSKEKTDLFQFRKLFDVLPIKIDSSQDKIKDQDITGEVELIPEGLIKVWDKPVAGYEIYSKSYRQNNFAKSLATTGVLIFLDSESGIIYEKDLSRSTSTPSAVTLDNPKLIMIQKTFFLNDENGIVKQVVLQYLDDKKIIKTKIATIPNSVNSLINLINLPDNIISISVSPDNQKLIYLVAKETNVNGRKDVYSDWFLLNKIYASPEQIYTSPLTIWNLLITNDEKIYAYEKDTAFENSNFYKLNIENRNENYLNNDLEKIYGDHTGLAFLITNTQKNILISVNTKTGIKTYLNNSFANFNKNFQDNNLQELSFKTLANKCVSSRLDEFVLCAVPKEIKRYDAGLPDAWYQGVASFEDNLYYLSLAENNSRVEIFYDFQKSADTNLDILNLKITPNDSHLIFINKSDRSLWSLNLNNIRYAETEVVVEE